MRSTRPPTALRVGVLGVVLGTLTVPLPASAFSVLAHQTIVDQSWERAVVPAIRRRFPHASAQELEHARPYAYGGAHIADLGYFPLGSLEFSNLMHYVRTGDLVRTLLESAETVNEYAFALGTLAHYVTDETGHPEATNRAVPLIYPKLRKKYGDRVTYADDHTAHLQTEFRFDVFQLTRSKQTSDLFHHAIAFEVAKPLLARAFEKTYALRLEDLFTSTDVAIATYRWGFRDLVHEATGIAWALYRSDIEKLDATATPASFRYELSRTDFEKEFGKDYRQPGYFARAVAWLVKLIPNVGPLKRLPYKPLPPETRRLFVAALDHSVARYAATVARAPHPKLEDDNLDTGRPTRGGEYAPADDAYATLVEKLDARSFAGVSPELRRVIRQYYRDPSAAFATKKHPDDWRKLRAALARLEARAAAVESRPAADANR